MDSVSPHADRSFVPGLRELRPEPSGKPVLNDRVVFGSWNVKGLTDLTLIELMRHMHEYHIDVLCLQETWVTQGSVRVEDDHMIIFSGSDAGARSWAGVGFIIAPRCRRYVKSFKQVPEKAMQFEVPCERGSVGNSYGVCSSQRKSTG